MTNPTLSSEATPADTSLRERVEDALRGVYDPEIPVNIYELGLIYELEVSTEGVVGVKNAFDHTNWPAGGGMPGGIGTQVRGVGSGRRVHGGLVWGSPLDKVGIFGGGGLGVGLVLANLIWG